MANSSLPASVPASADSSSEAATLESLWCNAGWWVARAAAWGLPTNAWSAAFEHATSPPAKFCSAPAAVVAATDSGPPASSATSGAMPPASTIAALRALPPLANIICACAAWLLVDVASRLVQGPWQSDTRTGMPVVAHAGLSGFELAKISSASADLSSAASTTSGMLARMLETTNSHMHML